MAVAETNLLDLVAQSVSRPGSDAPVGVTSSILAQAASSYGARPKAESTVPTGFDPAAAALFEAVVEAAFLVANSDGVFDEDERRAFQSVVAHACDNLVQSQQLEALLADLSEQLEEDGIDKRTKMVVRTITRADHQQEVLRIAALMAHISGGVSDPERSVMDQLASGFGLPANSVESALSEAESALSKHPAATD